MGKSGKKYGKVSRVPKAGYRHGWTILVLLFWFAAKPTLHGEEVATAPSVTPGGSAVELAVLPSGARDFHVLVPQGMTVRLIVEEIQQTSTVAWTDAQGRQHTPRTNRSGHDARISFTLIGRGGVDQFTVSSAAKHPALVRITVSAPCSENTTDITSQAGEEALATGDLLWGKHDAKTAPQVIAAYDSAIAAWRQLGNQAMLRRSLEWKAIELAFAGGKPEAAIPLLAEATAIPDADDIVQQASAWKTLGFVQTTLADYSDAWRDYAKALVLFQKTEDRFNQEVMLENRGKLSRMTGDYDGALADAKQAAAIARGLDDQIGVLHLEDDIGEIHLLRGEMQPAYDAFQEVLELKSISSGDAMIGFAETDLAELYHRLDADTRARDLLDRADAFWKAHPYLIGQLSTMIQEGRLETDSKHLAAAARIYQRGLMAAESAGMKRENVSMLLGLGNIARERHENDQATVYLDRALQLAGSLNEQDVLAEIYVAQGDLAESSEDFRHAAQCYRQALRVAERSYDHSGSIAALGGLAHAELSQGQDTEALAHIERALDSIESTRDFISVNSLRTAYFTSQHSYYAMAVRLMMRLDAHHPRAGYDRAALSIAEHARARSLLDQMRESGARLSSPPSPALAQSRMDTLRELHLAESSLAMRRRSTAESKVLRTHIADLLEQEDRIESAMGLKGSAGNDRLLPTDFQQNQDLIAELQAKLDAKTALLEYWTDSGASYLWVVTQLSVHAYTLPRAAALNALVSRMREDLQMPFVRTPGSAEIFAARLAAAQDGFQAVALRLGKGILPARSIPRGVRTLLVVGDGPLLAVPFEALRISSGHGAGSGAYIQDLYTVVREPSMGVLLELLRRPIRHQEMRIALFADPVFSAARSPMQPASAPAGEGAADAGWISVAGYRDLPRLAYAGQEAHEIAALAGPGESFVASGSAATRLRVRTLDWQDYAIAHFATHAFLNPSHPELDGILLSEADAGMRKQAGVLWFSDICQLHMPVELVVLSACQSANGELLPGEGVVGISYAFFVAGARRVVGSLWDVDDAATETLMREFYGAMMQGTISPAEALRRAQRRVAKDPRWSHPYFWAAFSIAGDWRKIP